MPDCKTVVFWSPVPAGARFRIEATGDQNIFNVVVGASRNGAHQPPLDHDQIVAGGATQVIDAAERWVFTPVIALFHDTQNPIIVNASIIDAAGNVVSVSSDGGTIPLKCTWQFKTEGASTLKIFANA